jgi:hypothetical protein
MKTYGSIIYRKNENVYVQADKYKLHAPEMLVLYPCY